MSGNVDLQGRLHRTVAEKLSEHLRTLDGDDPLSVEDEQALTRSLIAAELARLAEDAYRNGQTPLDDSAESDLAEAIFDRVHGLGRLQTYIDEPDLANIHVNGCDNVWLVYRDGTKVRGEAAADSDRDLIEMVSTAARRIGRSEKRWGPGVVGAPPPTPRRGTLACGDGVDGSPGDHHPPPRLQHLPPETPD